MPGLRLCVYVVVEEISESRDQVRFGGIVVVGPEDRRDLGVLGEDLPDTDECVGMDGDVRVDEDEESAHSPCRAAIPGRCRTETRGVGYDDHLLWRLGRGLEGIQAGRQRWRPVRRWYDRSHPIHHGDHRFDSLGKGSGAMSLKGLLGGDRYSFHVGSVFATGEAPLPTRRPRYWGRDRDGRYRRRQATPSQARAHGLARASHAHE